MARPVIVCGQYVSNEGNYSTGEMPEVGDVVECLPGEGGGTSEHEVNEGEQYTVTDVDCGYLFLDKDEYGWWPTRFALVERNGVRR